MTPSEKLAEHDLWATNAVAYLVDWLRSEPDVILAIAKGRHALGSVRYGDRLMYEYSQEELQAQTLEELADAVVYTALFLMRQSRSVYGLAAL